MTDEELELEVISRFFRDNTIIDKDKNIRMVLKVRTESHWPGTTNLYVSFDMERIKSCINMIDIIVFLQRNRYKLMYGQRDLLQNFTMYDCVFKRDNRNWFQKKIDALFYSVF